MSTNIRSAVVAVFVMGCGVQVGAVEQLLQDPTFNTLEHGQHIWSYSQHAGDVSYEYEGRGGVLRIRRIGIEPWGLLAQQVPVQALAGRKMTLSAEVQGDFAQSDAPVFEPASVNMIVKGWPENPSLRFMGMQNLVERRQVLPQTLAGDSWTPIELELTVPLTAMSLEVNFVMGYEGELRIRNPLLRVVEDSSAD